MRFLLFITSLLFCTLSSAQNSTAPKGFRAVSAIADSIAPCSNITALFSELSHGGMTQQPVESSGSFKMQWGSLLLDYLSPQKQSLEIKASQITFTSPDGKSRKVPFTGAAARMSELFQAACDGSFQKLQKKNNVFFFSSLSEPSTYFVRVEQKNRQPKKNSIQTIEFLFHVENNLMVMRTINMIFGNGNRQELSFSNISFK